MTIQIQSFELFRILNPLKFLITSSKQTLKIFLWEFGGKYEKCFENKGVSKRKNNGE
jgi:hypothetical protein